MMRGWKIVTRRDGFTDNIEVLIRHDDLNVLPLQFAHRTPGEIIGPTLVDSRTEIEDGATGFLRAALNAAWELGMRPDGFNDTTEAMKATRQHLDDMRTIAFNRLNIKEKS
jgi:hypothetical protein